MKRHREAAGSRAALAVLAGLAGAVALLLGVTGCGGGTEAGAKAGATGGAGAPAAHVDDHGVYGISVETEVRLPGDRVLLGGTLRMDGATGAVGFYRNDLPDSDAEPPKELPLPAGVPVLVSALLRPPCAAPAAEPRLELVIRSRRAGHEVVDRLSPAAPAGAGAVVRRWCGAGVRLAQGEFENFVDGRIRAQFEVSNPGPGPVTVAVARRTVDGATVYPASVTVPAGRHGNLVVHAMLHCGQRIAADGLFTVRSAGGTVRPIAPDESAEPAGFGAVECRYYVPPKGGARP